MARDRDIVQIGEYGKRVGETHGMAELSDAEVELVRELHEQGMHPDEIAEKMEVSKRYIYKLVNFERRASIAVKAKRARPIKAAPLARKPRREPESSLLTRIKAALRGSTGQRPVAEAALLALGRPESIRTALRLLACTHGVNAAEVTKDGETKTVYWEAGLLSPLARAALAVGSANFGNPFSPGGRERTTATLTQGETMRKTPDGKGSHIANTIKETPGIDFDGLLAAVRLKFPEFKASDLSSHLFTLKKKGEIEARGSRNKAQYYAAGEKEPGCPAAPALSEGAPQPEPLAPDRPAAAKPVPSPSGGGLGRGQPHDDGFAMMIHEDNHLHLELDGEPFSLTPERTLRLKRFLDRVTLEAA